LVRVLQHASDPAHHGPAGGLESLTHATNFLFLLAGVVGAMVGGTGGAIELEQGIFRDLVATGRARTALFAAKLPGALAVTLPVLALAAVLAAAGSVAFHGALPAPHPGEVLPRVAAVLLAGVVATAAGVGAGALGGSRGGAIAAVLALWLPISQVLDQAAVVGRLRALVPLDALAGVAGIRGYAVSMPPGVALAVLAGWVVAAVAAGMWSTARREL
jgi:hypothetical protein